MPDSLDLLDVVGNGMDCERFLWIRGLSDRELTPKARIDVVDYIQRTPGEVLHVASKDGRMCAALASVGDSSGAGSCFLSVFSRDDPAEPALGDLVELARQRAHRAGVSDVRCSGLIDHPYMQALAARHGFVEHDRWRRFHIDVASGAADAPLLPDGLTASTLAERGDLAGAAFRVHREGLEDAAGDFPRPDETLESWLRDIDGSPARGRELELVLHAGGEVRAIVELERIAMGSRGAWVEFLTVDREHRGAGLGTLAKQHAVALAAGSGLSRLQTINHADNHGICRLNEQLGWAEDPVRVSLRLQLMPAT